MKHQIQWTITSKHKLHVDGQWFKKKNNFEELQEEVGHAIQSQKIGDKKITMEQTIIVNDKNNEPSIETLTDLDIASFKTEWQSGWNPKLGQDHESETIGFFSSWKIEDFINSVTLILLLALLIYVIYLCCRVPDHLFLLLIIFLLHIPFFIHFIYLQEIE